MQSVLHWGGAAGFHQPLKIKAAPPPGGQGIHWCQSRECIKHEDVMDAPSKCYCSAISDKILLGTGTGIMTSQFDCCYLKVQFEQTILPSYLY